MSKDGISKNGRKMSPTHVTLKGGGWPSGGKLMTKKLICCLSWPGREDLSADLLPEISQI